MEESKLISSVQKSVKFRDFDEEYPRSLFINAEYWVLSENRKNNSQQEKTVCPNLKD